MTATAFVDPCRCPLCGAPNGCALAAGQRTHDAAPCWCTLERFSARLLGRVPEPARRKACICQSCAQADRDAP